MRRIVSYIICLLVVTGIFFPAAAFAREPERKTVRVGWYESPFEMTDGNGRRSGYAYEYQQRIANYTGWTYEYVEGSWPELMEMLIDGEIDLMSDVTYTEARSGLMLFPSIEMGTESYYLYIDADNTQINSEDLHTLNGKQVGINKGSYQAGLLRDWKEKNGLSFEIVELTDEEADSMNLLTGGVTLTPMSPWTASARRRV